MKILLDQPIKVKDEEVKELNLDFSLLNGRKLLSAETQARAMGDKTPQIIFSQKYQAAVAAKAASVPLDVLLDLPGVKFQEILMEVNTFLFSQGSQSE